MTTSSQGGAAPLRRSLLVAFTLPTLMLGIMHGPEGLAQSVYAKHVGLPLTALATAVLLTKMFDAVTYPLIGQLSDRSYSRSGTRKGWVIAGSILSVLGVWNLLRPPQGVDVFYFGLWMSVTYLGWKLMEIPLQAWSYGLSEDYTQRTRVQGWRVLAALVGTLLFFVVPYLAVSLGYSDSPELDFRSLGFSAVICAIALPLATLIAVARVPNGSAAPPPEASKRPSLGWTFGAIRKNGPLQRLLLAFLPFSLLTGVMNGVTYLYLDSYLGLAKQFPAIMLLATLASVVGIPFWSALATRFERHRVWVMSLVAGGVACGAFALIRPGPMALPLVFGLIPLALFTVGGAVIAVAMSADIVDYGRLVTGDDHSGLYGSILAFLSKSVGGVAAALGLAIVGACGFDASAASQSLGGIVGIKLTFGVLPALGMLGAAAVIWNYPLTRARMVDIQAQLHGGLKVTHRKP